MQRFVLSSIMFANIMHLGVAVVTRRNAIISARCHDLIELEFTVSLARFGPPRLQKAAAAAAAVVVRLVGLHIDKVFFTHHRFYDKSQILGHWITETLAHQLAWILNCKLYLQILVPVGIDFKLPLPDPFGIKLDNAFDLEVVLDLEPRQSDPDCEKFVPSLRVEPVLAP